MADKSITIKVSSFFKPKKWEILKIASSQQWSIVTEISEPDTLGTTLTTEPITLSKWKWIRNFQIWMLNKIFQSTNH